MRIHVVMADSDLEAKKLHIGRLEEVLVIPMFDIFHVQRAQLAEKTESQNSLLFHFKASMAKVRTWNASTIRNFIGGLTTRFPMLGEEFEKTFQELQEVTCRVLNASSSINEYSPVVEPTHTYLHELISACADSFISHPEWFQVSQSSPEYQTVLNNMKVRMAQSAVVPNAVMAFIKTSRREADADKQPNDAENSDMDIFDNRSEASDVSTVKGSKSINIKSGLVREEDPQADDAPTNPTPKAPTENTGADEGDTNADAEDGASDGVAISETGAGVGKDEEYDSSATFCCDDEYSSDLSLDSSGSEDLSMDEGGSEVSFSSDDGSYATSSASECTVESVSAEDDSSDDGSDDASEEGSEDGSDDGSDDASEDGSDSASEDGSEDDSDSCDSASSGADSSNSSEAATSLVWESVSDGSWYTADGSESGSDFE